ncbi:GH36 C-terminal domain-containing protein [Lysobacter capsici]|uniref:GH36 C-terminal domain-containing protein n=1 Tax=Lysobacter capsici TaxID=435897 RepID=UPI00398D0BEF
MGRRPPFGHAVGFARSKAGGVVCVLAQRDQGAAGSGDPFARLDPGKRYRIARVGGGERPESAPAEASGAYWMEHGVPVSLRGDFQAAAYVFEAK